jgi:hypothetical protein
MSILFNVTHEDGTLGEYDATITDGGDLSVTRAARLANTSYGLSCLIDDTTSIYGTINQTDPASGTIRWRFHVDPNAISMNNNTDFAIVGATLSASPWLLAEVYLRYQGGSYRINVDVYEDAGWLANDETNISDAEHYVEIESVRAANASSSDGELTVLIDGTQEYNNTSIDNYDAFGNLDGFHIGPKVVPATASGTIYLDEILANDDGGLIGPAHRRHVGVAHT